MLQVELKTFASDALEDAMRLAQTKALNSYSWSDMLNYLNYTWSDIYSRIAMIDDGYYGITVRLNTEITRLPPFVKNSLRVYAAQDPIGFNREVYRSSGYNDLRSRGTYHLSGFDLYCFDAPRRTVWLYYVPSPPMIFFTKNNRDPKLYEFNVDPNDKIGDSNSPVRDQLEQIRNKYRDPSFDYNMYTLQEFEGRYTLVYKNRNQSVNDIEITNNISIEDHEIIFITCDYPYIFITYRNIYSHKYISGFYKDILHSIEFIEYNPFEFTGRDSNVEYLRCKWNDKTGMGVLVIDHNDYDEKEKHNRIKELGFTPDTVLTYPCPEMYRYLVARLADKFSAFNETENMGVSKELVEAKYAFEAFCAKDKSAFKRIDNVNGPYIGDWL